jgi:hypothetical protein
MTANKSELDDIKNQFYLIMENYPEVYANYKMNPHLSSAMMAHESRLTELYRRMFAYQASIDKQMEENDSGLQNLTVQNSNLNTMLERKKLNLASTNETKGKKKIVRMPLREGFETITGLAGDDTPTPNQISMVDDARAIEKSAYYYSIARIVYLLAGISVVSYFIFKRVGASDSTILADAKMKVDELKNKVVQPAAVNSLNTNPPK